MSESGPWETIAHRVAIGGLVVDEAGKPCPGATLTLRAASRDEPVDGVVEESPAALPISSRTARQDGRFFFVDLEAGDYRLQAVDARGAIAARSVSVVRRPDGRIAPSLVELVLKNSRAEANRSCL